jgi:type I site-specific restriction-modification system R (restriction) subunit
MSGGGITEGIVEQAALDWFRSLGYATLAGTVLAPGGTSPERTSYDQVVLTGRLRDAGLRINPDLPAGVVEQAVTRLLRAESQKALAENERVHQSGRLPDVRGAVRTDPGQADEPDQGPPARARPRR